MKTAAVTPTPPEVKSKISHMLSFSADRFAYLYCRWQDEKEYEDFADYAAHMKSMLPDGFTFLRAKQRPFSFQFSWNGSDARYEMYIQGDAVGWRRLA